MLERGDKQRPRLPVPKTEKQPGKKRERWKTESGDSGGANAESGIGLKQFSIIRNRVHVPESPTLLSTAHCEQQNQTGDALRYSDCFDEA